MNEHELRTLRFLNQQLINTAFTKPEELVKWFGAVQAQDYYGALWGLGQRLQNTTQTKIERALSEKKIVRSWPMRGTLHFAPVEDLKWMVELLGKRVIKKAASRYRQLGLDNEVFAKSKQIIGEILQSKQLSRSEIYQKFTEAGISTEGQRGIHLLGYLALEGVICFGARKEKQQTFVLFDEWLPISNKLSTEESLAELAKRYFQSHGPATLQDFVWWSGLTVSDAKIGLESVKSLFETTELHGKTYWFNRPTTMSIIANKMYLLPSYDEYTVAYKDRSAILDPEHARNNDTGNGIFHPPMVINGEVIGLWKRVLKSNAVIVTPQPFQTLSNEEQTLFKQASQKYADFLELPLNTGKVK